MTDPVRDKELYSSGEIGRILGIPARTARYYLQTGRIPAEQNPLTGRWKVSRDGLAEFVRKSGMSPAVLQKNRQLRVMAVDDDEVIVTLIKSILEASEINVDVSGFTDSHEACLHLGRNVPDLLILDLHMPRVDGHRLLATLRETDTTSQLPVLVVSGFQDEMAEIKSTDRHVETLKKPFGREELVRLACQLLDLPVPGQPSGSSR